MAFLDLETRKRTFLRAVAPHLLKVNRGIAADRRRLVAISPALWAGSALSESSAAFVDEVGRRYGVPEARERLAAGRGAAAVALLLVHVDEVPVRLALAQAAVESGWGASKLAREDKSLFGQCVRRAGNRASAREGPSGLWYARFETLPDGVAAYVRNLNCFWAYEEFRKVRAAMRRRGVPLDSVRLADGLSPYSELGERYVAKVRAVIRTKEFNVFSRARLVPLSPRPASAGAPILALDGPSGVPGA
jgi:Bax protein